MVTENSPHRIYSQQHLIQLYVEWTNNVITTSRNISLTMLLPMWTRETRNSQDFSKILQSTLQNSMANFSQIVCLLALMQQEKIACNIYYDSSFTTNYVFWLLIINAKCYSIRSIKTLSPIIITIISAFPVKKDCIEGQYMIKKIVKFLEKIDLTTFISDACKRDECVIAGQNVFLGPAINLPCLGRFPESHHSRLIHAMYCSYRIRFQKRQ